MIVPGASANERSSTARTLPKRLLSDRRGQRPPGGGSSQARSSRFPAVAGSMPRWARSSAAGSGRSSSSSDREQVLLPQLAAAPRRLPRGLEHLLRDRGQRQPPLQHRLQGRPAREPCPRRRHRLLDLRAEADGGERLPIERRETGPRRLDGRAEDAREVRLQQQRDEQVLGANAAVAAASASSRAAMYVAHGSTGGRWSRPVLLSAALSPRSLSVLGMDRLARDTHRVADLLPRPSLLPRHRHLLCLYALGQTPQRQNRTQPDSRIPGRKHRRKVDGSPVGIVHLRQFGLTERRLSNQTDIEKSAAVGVAMAAERWSVCTRTKGRESGLSCSCGVFLSRFSVNTKSWSYRSRPPATLAGRPFCGDSRRPPSCGGDLPVVLGRDVRGTEKKPAV